MSKIRRPKGRQELRYRRHLRVRKRVSGTAERPRLVVFRSPQAHTTRSLEDDTTSRTLATVSDHKLTGKKSEKSTEVGKLIAQKAKDAGCSSVVFVVQATDITAA
jgi:large subunit ribosomal protein L18